MKKSRDKNRFKKRRKRLLLVFFTFAMTLFLAVILLVHTDLFKNYLVSKASDYLEEKFGISLRWDSFNISLTRLSLSAKEISLTPLVEEKSHIKFAGAHEIIINISARTLYSGLLGGQKKIHIQELKVRGPRIILGERSGIQEGPLSSGGRPVEEKPTTNSLVDIQIDIFDLAEGAIEYKKTTRFPLDCVLSHIRARAGYLDKDGRHQGDLRVGKGQIRTPSASINLKELVLGFAFDSQSIIIQELSIATDTTSINGSGWLRDYQSSPRFNFDVKSSIYLEEFSSLFPHQEGNTGIVALTASLRNTEKALGLSGTIAGENLTFRHVPISRIHASFKLEDNVLSVNHAEALLADGRLNGRLDIILPPHERFTLELGWDSIGLEKLGSFLADFPMLPASKSKGRIQAHGQGLDPTEMEASGEIIFSSKGLASKETAGKRRLDGKISFQVSRGKILVEKDSSLSFGGDILSLSGSLDREKNLNARFSLHLADLSSTENFLFLLNQKAKTPFLPAERPFGVAGQVFISGNLEGTLSQPTGRFLLQGQNLAFKQILVREITGTFESIGRDVDIPRFNVELERGSVDISGKLLMSSAEKDYGRWSGISLSIKEIDLAPFAGLLPEGLNRGIEGILTADISLTGSLLRPDVTFKAAASEIAIDKERIPLLSGEGQYKKGTLTLRNLYAEIGEGFLSGDLILDLDLNPKRYSLSIKGEKIDLSALNILKETGNNWEGLVTFDMEGKGDIDSPEFIFRLSVENTRVMGREFGSVSLNADSDGDRVETALDVPDVGVFLAAGLELKKPYVLQGLFRCAEFPLGRILSGTGEDSSPSLDGRISATADFSIPLDDWENISVTSTVEKIWLSYYELRMENASPLAFAVEEGEVRVQNFRIVGSGAELEISGVFPVWTSQENKPIPAQVKGKINLKFLQPFLKDVEIDGILSIRGQIGGNISEPRLNAEVRLEEGSYVHPLLSSPLRDVFVDLEVLDNDGEIKLISFSLGEGMTFANRGPIRFHLRDGSFFLDETVLTDGKSDIKISGSVTSLAKNPEVQGRVTARLEASSAAPLFEDILLDGTLLFDAAISGTFLSPSIQGEVEIRGGFFRLKEFPLMVSDLNGKILLENPLTARFRFDGVANGGLFKMEGRMSARDLGNIDLAEASLACENFQLTYPEGLISRSDISLQLEGNGTDWLLSGDIKIARAYYGTDIYPGTQLLNVAITRPYRPRAEVSSLLKDIQLDIGLSTVEAIVVDNNLANIEMGGNVKISGNALTPVLSGRVENTGMGEVVFGDRRYTVERARIDFLGTDVIDPELDLVAHTSLHHGFDKLEVTLELSGPLSNLTYSLNSFPPRSREDLALLLLTGRSLVEISGNAVNTLGNQMILHFAFPIASPFTQKLKQIFKAEDVSIEPLNIATEEDPGARFTFRKLVSPKAALTYSVDVTNSQHQTWMLDYHLTRNFSVMSFRKDDGSYGASFGHSFTLGGGAERARKLALSRRKQLSLKSVGLEGNFLFPRTELEKELRALKKGSTFDFRTLDTTINRLVGFYKKRGFLNSVIRPEIRYEDGVNVHITLHVSPGLPVRVAFAGDPLPRKVKREIVDSWNGRMPEEMAVEESKSLILNSLHMKRYYAATITHERNVEAGAAAYTFSVDKGAQYRIRNLILQGNASLNSSLIRKAITEFPSKKGKGLWVLVHDTDRALKAVKNLYEENGFLEARIGPAEIMENHEQHSIDIVLPVEEGPQNRVHSLEFVGTNALDAKELEKGLKLVKGSPFNPGFLLDDRNQILNRYKTRGYQDAHVACEIVRNKDDVHPAIVYRIDEGVEHEVTEIEISGHDRTSESLIRRELKIKEGDVLNLERLSLSQKSLYDTGVFRTVNVFAKPGEEEDGQDRVFVDVVEMPRFLVKYGLRYNSEEKLEGFGEVNFWNLLGGARNGLLFYRQNNRQKDFRLSLKDPYLFGVKLQSLYSLYFMQDIKASFITDEVGFSIQQQLRLPHDFYLSYLYRLNRIHTYEEESFGPFPFDISLLLSELSFSLVRDTREERLDARRGTFFSLNFSYSPEFLGSELTYISLFSQYSFFKQLVPSTIPGLVWASNLRVGLASAFDQELIPHKRFFAGGGNSVRGFKHEMVGPYDPYLRRPEGGEAVFLFNQELRFPIYKWLKGIVFYDAGNVYWSLRDFNPFDVRQGAGLGIRLESPVGLIRIDYGFNLSRRLDEPRSVVFLSIGQAF